jgi:predicted nucleic acid-binding protein
MAQPVSILRSWLEQRNSRAATSTITMTELLVRPYQNLTEQGVDELCGFPLTYPDLDWIAPTIKIATLATRFRALHRLKTPDALQPATAAYARTTGLITNDAIFERVGAFEALVLDRLL